MGLNQDDFDFNIDNDEGEKYLTFRVSMQPEKISELTDDVGLAKESMIEALSNGLNQLSECFYDHLVNYEGIVDVKIERSIGEFNTSINSKLSEIQGSISTLINSIEATSLCWIPFNAEEWQQSGEFYTLVVADAGTASYVYKDDTDGKKTLIFSVDISVNSDNEVILTSFEPFDGYVLGTRRTIEYSGEDEDDNEFTEEELEALIVDSWEEF